jgi:hypothetical protein
LGGRNAEYLIFEFLKIRYYILPLLLLISFANLNIEAFSISPIQKNSIILAQIRDRINNRWHDDRKKHQIPLPIFDNAK